MTLYIKLEVPQVLHNALLMLLPFEVAKEAREKIHDGDIYTVDLEKLIAKMGMSVEQFMRFITTHADALARGAKFSGEDLAGDGYFILNKNTGQFLKHNGDGYYLSDGAEKAAVFTKTIADKMVLQLQDHYKSFGFEVVNVKEYLGIQD